MEVIVTIVSKLVYNLFTSLTIYVYSCYNPFTNYQQDILIKSSFRPKTQPNSVDGSYRLLATLMMPVIALVFSETELVEWNSIHGVMESFCQVISTQNLFLIKAC